MQHRNATQSHQGRSYASGRNGPGNRRNHNWRNQERDEEGRFTDQNGGEGRFSRGSNDNWRYEERDERGRFTDQGYRGSRGYGDYEDEDGAYGRARNQGQDYGFVRGRFGDRNYDDDGGYVGASSQGRSGWQNQDNQFDDDYNHWRNEQISKLDEDYKAWQAERRQKFSDEFGKWRSERMAKSDTQNKK